MYHVAIYVDWSVLINTWLKLVHFLLTKKLKHKVSLRRSIEKLAGGIGSANADMSNDKGGEKPPRQKSKV